MSSLTPYPRRGRVAYVDVAPVHSGDAHDLLRIWTSVSKRWRIFLTVALGFVALVAAATMIAPKSYTTTARLMAGRPSRDIAAQQNDTALPVLNALVLQNGEQTAETFAQLAQQRDIAQKVIKDKGLRMTPRALLLSLSVKPVVNTALLNLSVTGRTSEQSAEITNAFAEAFIEQERNFVRSEAVAALGFLSKELPKAEVRLRTAQSRLARFQATNGYIDIATHEQDLAARIALIDQHVDQLRVDASEAGALLDSVTHQMTALRATTEGNRDVAPNPILADLRAKLTATETQLAEAQQQYTAEHPLVIALRRQRATLLAQIAAQPASIVSRTSLAPNPLYESLKQQAATYRARIEGDQGQLAALRAQRGIYGPRFSALPGQAMDFASIRQDATRAENVYTALAHKYSDAQIATTTAISDIFIVERARPDAAVKRPSLLLNLSIAAFAGLLLALAVVYVLEMLEQRRRSDDASTRYGLPVLARIPMLNPANKRMLPWAQSMTVEAFLHLCVTLRRVNTHRLRTLAVLSPCRGDGKSTVAYNLANAMASLEPRILLVDADMRHPTLHERANCPNTVGLSEVLHGSASLEDAVQEIAPGLDLLTSRSTVHPLALLQLGFETFLATAQERYSMVIVDAPAVTAVSEGLLIATHVDGTLVVIAKHTDDESARKTISQMASLHIDNVVGLVVNKDAVRVNDYDDYFAPGTKRAIGSAPS
jgi:polysaccharide biosynthesis transport protein